MDEKPSVNRLKQRRQQLGLTQDQLAIRSGLHRSEVCRIEKGYIAPPKKKELALAKALGWAPAYLAKVLSEISLKEVA